MDTNTVRFYIDGEEVSMCEFYGELNEVHGHAKANEERDEESFPVPSAERSSQ